MTSSDTASGTDATARPAHPEGSPGPTAVMRQGVLERMRQPHRPVLWQEITFVGIAYFLYSLVRNGVPEHRTLALQNAFDIMGLQDRLGLGSLELDANQWLAAHHLLSVTADYWYATMHFAITAGVLIWLWVSHPLRYRYFRSILVATTLIGLLGFWLYPLAPPRMLPGFVDTVVRDHIWGSWGTSGMDSASNQYAAMPSMHIGWSTWCALVVCMVATATWVRLGAWLYPLITLAVIVGTANHFWLDAVGGLAALALGALVVALLYGQPPWRVVDDAPHRGGLETDPDRLPILHV